MTGKDENNVPMLHWRPDHHFERLVAFLASRSEFTQDMQFGAATKRDAILKRIESLHAEPAHLTPNTDIMRLAQVLGGLIRHGQFKPTSQLHKAFADITDAQIISRDESIAHRLPVFFGPKDLMFNPNSQSIGTWKEWKETEDATGVRNPSYGYAGMPIRPLADFEEDNEKKSKRNAGKGKGKKGGRDTNGSSMTGAMGGNSSRRKHSDARKEKPEQNSEPVSKRARSDYN